MTISKIKDYLSEIIKPLGLVFGDIGTSPIYTLTIVFLLVKTTPNNIYGALSLLLWTLTIVVTIKYVWIVTSLSKKGEGGTIVLKEIVIRYIKSPSAHKVITILALIGVAFLIGDGVITPAISILSAVEGLKLIDLFKNITQETIIIISAVIAILLFVIQAKGTDKISKTFGPIMLIWFIALAVSGGIYLVADPNVLRAINPMYAIEFLSHETLLAALITLFQIFLCVTGAEALYADMGHLGRKPIISAWWLVYISLILCYTGQAAFLISHPEAENVLFEMIFSESKFLYVPFPFLTIMATIIASQAMISGVFSIIYQGITTNLIPLLKISYTSKDMRSQIYIGFVNWFMLIAVLIIMFIFKESANLGNAYGLAVCSTMVITSIFITIIFIQKKDWFKLSIAIPILLIDLIFLISNGLKIPAGGYFSILVAMIPFCTILVYQHGSKKLYKNLKPMPIQDFLDQFEPAYKNQSKVNGTALYFIRDTQRIPPYIVRTMFNNGIIYDDNIFVSIDVKDKPYGKKFYFAENITDGLRHFVIHLGYLEIMNISDILHQAEIEEKVIFYGTEEITTSNIILKVFSIMRKLTPSFVEFYKLPLDNVHGVVTKINM